MSDISGSGPVSKDKTFLPAVGVNAVFERVLEPRNASFIDNARSRSKPPISLLVSGR